MLRDARGSAAVEFALLFPFLLLTILGLIDLGWETIEAETASAAAQSGTAYVTNRGFDSVGISNAVASSSSLTGIAANPAPSNTYTGCASATGIGTLCGGQTPGTYAVVAAKATFTPILNWVQDTSSYSSTYIVRIH